MIPAEKFLETIVEKAKMDPREMRAELKALPTDGLIRLLGFCQERAGRDLPRRNYGLVHQDIVNILGERLGFTVEFGDYEKGPDGIWSYGDVKIIVESKTSSAWLQVRQVHDYVRELNASSGLAIAPEFTEDNLMAARSYGDVRLLTTNGLGRLLELKEGDRLTTDSLVKILVPVESVKLDYFIDIIYAIAKPRAAPEKPVEKPGKPPELGKPTEEQHLKKVVKGEVVATYEKIKQAMLRFDPEIKFIPQKYYIAVRKTRNFAYMRFSKAKMRIVVMLPYEVGSGLIKKHPLIKLSQAVQDWYGAPCFRVIVESEADLEEVVKALEEAYRHAHK
ncbi:hypothetical protein KEJ27_09745 [Candidatus Bathyarchaeota archaeon]|nr:hypothetical protein [Candidatus Bathyarchaeota archaeon]